MILYTPSLLHGDYSTLTFSGVTDPLLAVDNDKRSVAMSGTANPTLALDLGAGESEAADSLWLRVTGYTAVSIRSGNPAVEIVSETIPSSGYLYVEFTEATSRNWSLAFTGTGGVYEAYLCKRVLDFDTDDKRPVRWRMSRSAGVFERAVSGALVHVQPFGFGGGRTEIRLSWHLLDNVSVAELEKAWRDGVDRLNAFGVYPVPGDRPNHFFQARWDSPFAFQYDGARVQDGQSGEVLFAEDSVILGEA